MLTAYEKRDWVRVVVPDHTGTQRVDIQADARTIQGRMAEVDIAGQRVIIRQDGSISSNGCSAQGSGSNMQMGMTVSPIPASGIDAFTLLTLNSCEWTLYTINGDGLVSFPEASRGIGNGTVRVKIAPNPYVSERTATVRQSASEYCLQPDCAGSDRPIPQSVGLY